MSKVKTVNYDGSSEEVAVSDEVFEVFEDSRKLDQRLAKSDQRHIDKYENDTNEVKPSATSSNVNIKNSVHREVERHIFAEEIYKKIMSSTFTDEERDVIKMKYVEGLKNVEIAERLGISKQAVGKKIENILRKMR